MELVEHKKLRAKKILFLLKKNYGFVPNLFLNYSTDAQMLVAIILSAQSTDNQINKVTKKLFKKYKTVNDFANAKKQVFEKEIYSTGFYKQKAKNIISCFLIIKSKFNSKIPLNMSDLISLPGVGRKTANLILLNKGIVEGIAVDTHVFRLSRRFGLSKSKNANDVEKDLKKIYKKIDWPNINKLFITHGRNLCTAINPKCDNCFLNKKFDNNSNICLKIFKK
ncbi:MAG: endonuclease III [Candidatus ainarchaeum sp.]|nr:endonuclease III [Candidatus ainarchaeum sp.]